MSPKIRKTTVVLTLAGLSIAATIVVGNLGSAQSNLPPVTLSFYYPGPGVPADLKLIQEAASAITKQKINATIELNPIEWGSWAPKMDLMMNSGQSCDVVFTSFWTGTGFARYAASGALQPLDALLPQYAPKTLARYTKETWRAAQVGGKTYAVIHYSGYPAYTGVRVLSSLARKYNLKLSDIRKFADLTPFLAAVKKGEPGIVPLDPRNSAFSTEVAGFDPVIDPLAIRYNDKSLKVFNMYDSAAFKEAAALARRWYQAGFVPTDAVSDDDAEAAYKAGKYAVSLRDFNPFTSVEVKKQYGFEIVGKSLSPLFKTTNGITNTMNAVCRSSKNPERALMFLELVQTDRQLFNTLANGIEGKHWVFADKANGEIKFPDGVTAQNSGYNPGTPWAFGGNHDLDLYQPLSTPADRAALTLARRTTARAKASEALGFVLNPDSIKTELAQISAIVKQYADPIKKGLVDPATAIPDLNSRLAQAGLSKVSAEVQRQLNEWNKTATK